MIFIQICISAKNETSKIGILDWLINQVLNPKKGTVSMSELLERYMDEITFEDNDTFNYHDIGWNFTDAYDLFTAKQDLSNLEIPKPSYRFWRW